MNPINEQIAEKCALSLPPDVLEHPMPLPSRLIYAAKKINSAITEATEPLQREIDQWKSDATVLVKQIKELQREIEEWKVVAARTTAKANRVEQLQSQIEGYEAVICIAFEDLCQFPNTNENFNVAVSRTVKERNELQLRLAQSEKACAEMRNCINHISHESNNFLCKDEREAIVKALSSTAGQDYVHKDQIFKPMNESLNSKAEKDKKRLDWLEEEHTLHNQIEIVYVVDGYQVQATCDGNTNGPVYHGETLRQAIDNAMEDKR